MVMYEKLAIDQHSQPWIVFQKDGVRWGMTVRANGLPLIVRVSDQGVAQLDLAEPNALRNLATVHALYKDAQ